MSHQGLTVRATPLMRVSAYATVLGIDMYGKLCKVQQDGIGIAVIATTRQSITLRAHSSTFVPHPSLLHPAHLWPRYVAATDDSSTL
jgi:hypothetical protein